MAQEQKPTQKARRQEQEDARREVTEVAKGVLRMQLPIHMPGLGHVNMYALLDDEGVALVDPGLPGPATWKAIKDRLVQADLAVKDIHTVIVTHSHPDHFGGASRIVKESGARVVAHEFFRFGPMEAAKAEKEPEVSIDDLSAQQAAARGEPEGPSHAHHGHSHGHGHGHGQGPRPGMGMRPWARPGSTPWGGEHPRPPFRQRLRWMAMRWMGRTSFVPDVSHPVGKGATLRLCGREWFIVHTPGHTEDHICLHDPADGVFLAGDHVLPSITPHISGLSHSPDPLMDFFESLDRAAAIPDVKQVLPAHGHPFRDLAERCDAIKRHHHERLDKVKEIGRALGPTTVEAFTRRLFKPRSWGSMAESETYAHLEHLRLLGDAELSSDADGNYIYETG